MLARYAAVAPASILGLSDGLFSVGAWPGQRPLPLFGANLPVPSIYLSARTKLE